MSFDWRVVRSASTLEKAVAVLRTQVQRSRGTNAKLPAISELAKRLGVSSNTVGAALATLALTVHAGDVVWSMCPSAAGRVDDHRRL